MGPTTEICFSAKFGRLSSMNEDCSSWCTIPSQCAAHMVRVSADELFVRYSGDLGP